MPAISQGAWTDLALHTIGWKAFQDLCAQVCAEVLKRPVEIYREAQDGGQDAVFLGREDGENATIQCKFSSDFTRRLRSSDLNQEIEHIKALVQSSDAYAYILITSMGVDAGVARKIKAELRSLGVVKPHVFGKEFLIRAIRSSGRLRALVPQVYGLGDLSVILDERKAAQTRALLGQWLPTLRAYVPTTSHRKAVNVIAKHGIVLLLGNPATGKSTIAAVLAAMACESDEHTCFQVDGPREFVQHWNPEEKNRFYWIDDAFGANQLRDEYVHDWAEIFRKVQAAVEDGNRFVLTSRRHIYEAAKPRLGTRNLPVFANLDAVVDVGGLSTAERRQILYNQIKFGGQPTAWKKSIKIWLDDVAKEPKFLAGMAKRLADPAFTKNLSLNSGALRKFISEPREHLVRTIEELSQEHFAALALVFVHRGKLSFVAPDEAATDLVAKTYRVESSRLHTALRELSGSFLALVQEDGEKFWVFDHPTILDALTAILIQNPASIEMFLRGASVQTIVGNVVCSDFDYIRDALVVPKPLEELLLERLGEVPNESAMNRMLFSFLLRRASDDLLRAFFLNEPGCLNRPVGNAWSIMSDPRYGLCARIYKLGLLSDEFREVVARELEDALFYRSDTSFVNDEDILALITPRRLVGTAVRIRSKLIPSLHAEVERIVEDADLDIEPESNFDDLRESLSELEALFEDDQETLTEISDVEGSIYGGIEKIAERKQNIEREDNTVWEWDDENYRSAVSKEPSVSSLADTTKARSIFSDLDE